MLRLIFSKNTVKLVVFLFFIFTTSCLSLKTVTTDRLIELQVSRDYLKIHSEDSTWILNKYQVTYKMLKGKIVRNHDNIPVLRTVDVYIPASHDVKVEGDILTISTDNIGKVDYKILDGLMIISSVGVVLVLVLFVPLFFY
jgi:hypothetical protein